MVNPALRSTLFPYTTLFRSAPTLIDFFNLRFPPAAHLLQSARLARKNGMSEEIILACLLHDAGQYICRSDQDRKSTRLNSSHVETSYAVFCLKKKKSTDIAA